MQKKASKNNQGEPVSAIARELGFGDEIMILDLVGGCGVVSELTGKLWRVFEPASGRAFVICLAEAIRKSDIESLGLNKETPLVCYEGALDKGGSGVCARTNLYGNDKTIEEDLMCKEPSFEVIENSSKNHSSLSGSALFAL